MRAALALLAVAAVGVSGCESTQSKSARLRAASKSRRAETGLKVTRPAPGVKVTSTQLLTDPNGTALVVELRNTTKRTLAGVPLAVNLADRSGTSVYRNDTPGLERSLVSAALLPARASTLWVNDQVTASGKPAKATARPGAGGKVVRAAAPRLTISALKAETDPTSGVAATGTVTNHSKVDQRDLVVNVVARRGGRVTAAGRAVVRRLKAGGHTRFQAFLIGTAKGARLSASAPPTTLR